MDELAELVELGRLQRDGITGLDRHERSILADGAAARPVDHCPHRSHRSPGARYVDRRRPASDGIGRRDLRVEALEACRAGASRRRRRGPTCGRPARRTTGRAPSTSRSAPPRSRAWYSSQLRRGPRGRPALNFQLFSGSSIRAWRRSALLVLRDVEEHLHDRRALVGRACARTRRCAGSGGWHCSCVDRADRTGPRRRPRSASG